jgi:large subunit ribosomal protein L28
MPPASSDILRGLARPVPAGNPSELLPNWSNPVASVCDVCGKGPGFGNNVSHSHRRTPRRWNPNIQRVRAVVGKTPRRLNVCTSCIKAGKVTR